jgi:alpha-glucosidase
MASLRLKSIFALGLAASPAFAQAPAPVTATSPDGTIVLSVATNVDGKATWSLSRKGKLLISASSLGFILTDGLNMVRGFSIAGSAKASGGERWEQPWGERRFVTDKHNELLVRFRQSDVDGGRLMNVRFRLFDNGFGLRYELPEQPALKTMKIADELTEFAVAQPGTAWWIPGGEWNRYEQVYQKTPIDAVSTAHTPITMRLDDGTHLSFHEAALVDYSAMWLKRISGTTFRSTCRRPPTATRSSANCHSLRHGAPSASPTTRRAWSRTTLS